MTWRYVADQVSQSTTVPVSAVVLTKLDEFVDQHRFAEMREELAMRFFGVERDKANDPTVSQKILDCSIKGHQVATSILEVLDETSALPPFEWLNGLPYIHVRFNILILSSVIDGLVSISPRI
jgi:hypothetical protein